MKFDPGAGETDFLKACHRTLDTSLDIYPLNIFVVKHFYFNLKILIVNIISKHNQARMINSRQISFNYPSKCK